jgi:hypothetical protein
LIQLSIIPNNNDNFYLDTDSIVSLRWNQTGITVAGTGTDQLNAPVDATLDYQNSLCVADYDNNRIQKFLMYASDATTVAGNASGIGGTSLNQLKLPAQALIFSNGDMFVTDTYNYRILMWSNGSPSAVVVAGVTGRRQKRIINVCFLP